MDHPFPTPGPAPDGGGAMHTAPSGPVPPALHRTRLAGFDGEPIEAVHTDLATGRPTLVLVLPFGLRHEAARGFFAAMAGRFDVVTWESRFVLNFEAGSEPGPIRADMHAGDLVAIVDHFGLEPADVVGYCSGAGIALLAASRHPDRFRRLALVCGEFMLPPSRCRQTGFQREVFVVLPAAAAGRAEAALLHEKIAAGSARPTHEFHEFVSLPFSSPDHLYRFGLNYLAYRDLDILGIAASVPHDTLPIATRHDEQVTIESAEIVTAEMPAARPLVVLDGDHYELCRGNPHIADALTGFLASGDRP